jgi:lipopolysaccharide export system protein LptA
MSRITTLNAVTGLFLVLLVSLLICCPLTYAAKGAKESKQTPDLNTKLGSSQSPIYITADRMEANQDQKIIIFESHVVVRQDDLTITSNRLKVTLLQGENQPASGDSSPTEKIDYIEFEGDVKVTQQDRLATADKAIFYQKEQKILLKGRPVVTQGQDRIEGNLITIYLKEGRSIVEGGNGAQVQAVLFPGKKE